MKTKSQYIKPTILILEMEFAEVMAGTNIGENADIPTNHNSADGYGARAHSRNFWDTEEE